MARMTKPAREELSPFANQIARLRYRAVRHRMGNPEFEIWSFALITDPRTQMERYQRQPPEKGNEAPRRLKASIGTLIVTRAGVK